MKILHKHVAREIMGPFVLALLVMTFLTLMGELLQELANRFTSGGLGAGDIGMIMLYVLPVLLTYTIPIALLFAVLAAYVQISQGCEVIAMKAAGMSIRGIFAPAILIGVAATLVLIPLCAEISPWARREMKIFMANMVLEKPTLMLREQAWTPEFNGMRIFVGEIGDKDMTLRDVTVMISPDGEPRRTIVAESGWIEVDKEAGKIFIELNNGSIHEYDPETPEDYSTVTFGALKIPAAIRPIERYIGSIKKYEEMEGIRKKEMPIGRLVRGIFDPGTKRWDRGRMLAEIGMRSAMAFMPLAFVLVGAPLGVIPYRTRRFYGLAVCGLLLLAYYALLMVGEELSQKNLVNPLIAMWIPNILIGLAGVAFIVRAERH